MFHTVGSDMQHNNTQNTLLCFMAMLLIFNILVKATSAHQKYKENSFLDFHGNNAYVNVPQC